MVNKVNIVFYVALLWTHLKLPAVAVTTTQLLAYLSVCGKTYFAICRLLQFSYFLKPQHSPWSLSLKRQSCFNPQYRTPLNAHPRYGIFAHFATFATLLVSRIGWSHQLFFSLAVSPCPSSIQERWMNLSEEGCNISSLVTTEAFYSKPLRWVITPSEHIIASGLKAKQQRNQVRKWAINNLQWGVRRLEMGNDRSVQTQSWEKRPKSDQERPNMCFFYDLIYWTIKLCLLNGGL